MVDRLSSIFSAEEIEELHEHLSKANDILMRKCVALSSAERTKLVKARIGSEKYLGLLLKIAKDYGINLPNNPLDTVQIDVVLQEQLSLVISQLHDMHSVANDTSSLARAEAWNAFLDYYSVLSAMGQRTPEIASRMKQVTEFMAYGPRKNGKKKATEEEQPAEAANPTTVPPKENP